MQKKGILIIILALTLLAGCGVTSDESSGSAENNSVESSSIETVEPSSGDSTAETSDHEDETEGDLYMLDQGATATWEHWNGMRSRMHNCFNGIGSWFYQALGGIVADAPGYRHVVIRPQHPKGLQGVRVSQETPYGTIVVHRDGTTLNVELPIGVTATIEGREYGAGKHQLTMGD